MSEEQELDETYAKAQIIGVVRDIKQNTTNNGKKVANLRVQCGKHGTFKVTVWETLAEMAEGIGLGSRIVVDGRLDNRSYESGGVKKWEVVITASTFEVIDVVREDEPPSF